MPAIANFHWIFSNTHPKFQFSFFTWCSTQMATILHNFAQFSDCLDWTANTLLLHIESVVRAGLYVIYSSKINCQNTGSHFCFSTSQLKIGKYMCIKDENSGYFCRFFLLPYDFGHYSLQRWALMLAHGIWCVLWFHRQWQQFWRGACLCYLRKSEQCFWIIFEVKLCHKMLLWVWNCWKFLLNFY